MDADEMSPLVALAENLVYKRTGRPLEAVEKHILTEILSGNQLKSIKFPGYEKNTIERGIAPKLWKLLSEVTGKKVTAKKVISVLQELQKEHLQEQRTAQVRSQQNPHTQQECDRCVTPAIVERDRTNEQQTSSAPNTSTWHNFINSLKPGVPLLLSAAFIGCGFGLSWLANWYGVTNHLAGELPKAQAGYNWALKLNPGSPSGHYNLGNLYEDQQNYQAANEQYSKAMRDDFVAASAYNNKARLYIIQDKNPTAAFDLLQKALPLAKDKIVKSDIHKNMGWVLLKQRRYSEAEAHLRTAIELTRSRASSYCLLAQILDRRGDKKAALVQWQQCLGYASMYNKDEAIWIGMARQRINNVKN
ncbi:tetratricopeptide repeat protein [Microseira wollei]|uniref:TPR repeat-containing protein n=1 Tax=Microseira wollei NIES-4236 TaxID=2530354 RepID=A0AAV3XD46_9CYAN|nr:tetratricopeptide repeat protein [Microseira wollei]GET37332.1 TPR repeat-containing protein [Microseira wollei NIES-4236]